jgi:hypothetical protein
MKIFIEKKPIPLNNQLIITQPGSYNGRGLNKSVKLSLLMALNIR